MSTNAMDLWKLHHGDMDINENQWIRWWIPQCRYTTMMANKMVENGWLCRKEEQVIWYKLSNTLQILFEFEL